MGAWVGGAWVNDAAGLGCALPLLGPEGPVAFRGRFIVSHRSCERTNPCRALTIFPTTCRMSHARQAAGQQGMQGTDLLVYLLDRNDRAVAELKASMKEGFKEVKSQVKEGGAVLGKRLEQGEARLRALEDLLLRAQTLLAVAIFLYGVVQKWEVIKSFVSSLFS